MCVIFQKKVVGFQKSQLFFKYLSKPIILFQILYIITIDHKYKFKIFNADEKYFIFKRLFEYQKSANCSCLILVKLNF